MIILIQDSLFIIKKGIFPTLNGQVWSYIPIGIFSFSKNRFSNLLFTCHEKLGSPGFARLRFHTKELSTILPVPELFFNGSVMIDGLKDDPDAGTSRPPG
jgi:hypothetical protein